MHSSHSPSVPPSRSEHVVRVVLDARDVDPIDQRRLAAGGLIPDEGVWDELSEHASAHADPAPASSYYVFRFVEWPGANAMEICIRVSTILPFVSPCEIWIGDTEIPRSEWTGFGLN
jgi:hypothetical protein